MIQFAYLNRERREKLSDYYHFRALVTELLDKSRRPIQSALFFFLSIILVQFVCPW